MTEPQSELRITDIDETYIRVSSREQSIHQELWRHFTYEVEGRQFIPAFKDGFWDGCIHLYNDGRLYKGLFRELQRFAWQRGYKCYNNSHGVSCYNPVGKIELPEGYEERDYQIETIKHCVKNMRALILSPTASGKSLTIYSTIDYIQQNLLQTKALIIVPTVSLVSQMSKDIDEYSKGKYTVKKIKAGEDKDCRHADIVVSTWQSLLKEEPEFFSQFGIVVGDEAHRCTAKCLRHILESMKGTKYRFGFTGSLDETKTNKMMLEGLFGPVMEASTTKKLIDDGTLSPFQIKSVVLKYKDEECKKKRHYLTEIDFLIKHQRRNCFIRNLANKVEGTTLVLFDRVEEHGRFLYNLIKEKADKPVFFLHGGVSADQREAVREQAESSDIIIVASYGVYSTGVNIPRLMNVVFASPSKSRIKNMQSIGRVLRKHKDKKMAVLYDIADDLSHRTRKNYSLKHWGERIKLYASEGFDYKITKMEI